MLGLLIMILAGVSLTGLPFLNSIGDGTIERWYSSSTSSSTETGIQVTNSPYMLPQYIYDVEFKDGVVHDLNRFFPVKQLDTSKIPFKSAIRIKIIPSETYSNFNLICDAGHPNNNLSITLEDSRLRPLSRTHCNKEEPLNIALTRGVYRLELTAQNLPTQRLLIKAKTTATNPDTISQQKIELLVPIEQTSIPKVNMAMSPVAKEQWDALRLEALNQIETSGFTRDSIRRIPANLSVEGEQTQVEVWTSGQQLKVHVSEETPSFTVEQNSGPLLFGMSRFKLISIRAEQGIQDYVLSSLLFDEGILVYRKLLVNLSFNDRNLGVYIVEETPKSSGFFEGIKRIDGQVHTMGKNYADSEGAWESKPDLTKSQEMDREFFNRVNSIQYAKTLALMTSFQATHGLETGDIRFYRPALLERSEPIVRDLNMTAWPNTETSRALLTHSNWWVGRNLIQYGAHTNPKPFPEILNIPTGNMDYESGAATLGLSMIHPANMYFIQNLELRELFEQYLIYLSKPIFHQKFVSRMRSTFKIISPYLNKDPKYLPPNINGFTFDVDKGFRWSNEQPSNPGISTAEFVNMCLKHSFILVDNDNNINLPLPITSWLLYIM